MTPKEMYFTMLCSVAQGILEGELGYVGEIATDLLADESIKVTDSLMKKFYEKFGD